MHVHFACRYDHVSDEWEPPQAKPYKDLVSSEDISHFC